MIRLTMFMTIGTISISGLLAFAMDPNVLKQMQNQAALGHTTINTSILYTHRASPEQMQAIGQWNAGMLRKIANAAFNDAAEMMALKRNISAYEQYLRQQNFTPEAIEHFLNIARKENRS